MAEGSIKQLSDCPPEVKRVYDIHRHGDYHAVMRTTVVVTLRDRDSPDLYLRDGRLTGEVEETNVAVQGTPSTGETPNVVSVILYAGERWELTASKTNRAAKLHRGRSIKGDSALVETVVVESHD